jgi:hypothetical protein
LKLTSTVLGHHAGDLVGSTLGVLARAVHSIGDVAGHATASSLAGYGGLDLGVFADTFHGRRQVSSSGYKRVSNVVPGLDQKGLATY